MTTDKRLNFFELGALGFLLFAMFLGAGNIIFAPMVGQEAGTDMWIPMSGFLITGVGLVFLAIVALAKTSGDVHRMASRVSNKYAIVFCLVLFLTLGPIYVIPRTTSVVFEIGVLPSLAEQTGAHRLPLLIFSTIFIAATIWLSLNPNKLVDRIGKILTPAFGILLIIIIVTSIVNPMGQVHEPLEAYQDGAFFTGFIEGYLTMDAAAALVFAGVFIQAIRSQGVNSNHGISTVFFKAGLFTVVALAILHVSLAWIGGSSVDAIGRMDNGGQLLAEASRYLLGQPGLYVIGTVVFLTGLTTNVACLTAVADYFARVFPCVGYKRWVWINAALGFGIANLGLDTVLSAALPVLFLLYPLSMVLILLTLVDGVFGKARAVYVGATIATAPFAILDAIRAANVDMSNIDPALSFIPLFTDYGGWIIPAILGAVIGYIYAQATAGKPEVVEEQSMEELADEKAES